MATPRSLYISSYRITTVRDIHIAFFSDEDKKAWQRFERP